jgi:hypothetical protein
LDQLEDQFAATQIIIDAIISVIFVIVNMTGNPPKEGKVHIQKAIQKQAVPAIRLDSFRSESKTAFQ